MSKILNKSCYLILLFAVVLSGFPYRMYAATPVKNSAKCYDISANRVYTEYDITGDNKKDEIEVKTVSSSVDSSLINGLTVYINKKNCLENTYSAIVKPTIKLIRLKNGKPYLYISATNQDDSYNSGDIYRYQSSKLYKVLNLTGLVGKVRSYWDDYAWDGNSFENVGGLSECIHEVSGNCIYIRIIHSDVHFDTGNWIYRYNYKNGKLKMHKTFPLKYSKLSIDLKKHRSSYGSLGEQIWPFLDGFGTSSEGNVIPVKVTSSNNAVVKAYMNSHIGSGFSLIINALRKGRATITITAADGRTAKLKVTVK